MRRWALTFVVVVLGSAILATPNATNEVSSVLRRGSPFTDGVVLQLLVWWSE